MATENRRWPVWVLAACILIGIGIYWTNRPAPSPTGLSPFAAAQADAMANQGRLPMLFEAPSFKFVDHHGRPSTNEQLKGRIWIANFIFTSCSGVCPKVTAKMVEVQNAIEDPEVRFVTFSVDPERDDPPTLARYAQTNNASESRWLLLRPPDRATIGLVAQKMAAVAHSGNPDDEILHTDFLVLIDENGQVRSLYDSKDPAMVEQIKRDVAKLAREGVMDTLSQLADDQKQHAVH